MKRIETGALTLFLLLAGISCAAANGRTPLGAVQKQALAALHKQAKVTGYHADSRGEVRLIYGELSAAVPAGGDRRRAALAFLERNKGLFGLESAERELAFVQNAAGTGQSIKLQQVYAGLPVFERSVTVHFGPDGRIRAVTGNLAADSAPASTRPAFPAAEAVRKAVPAPSAGRAAVRDPDLGVFCDERTGRPHLAYAVPLSKETVFVDAQTGEVLHRRGEVHEAATTGTGTNALGQAVDPLNMYAGQDFTIPNDPRWQNVMQNAAKGAFNLVDYFNLELGIIYGMNAQGQEDRSQLIFIFSDNNVFGAVGASQVVQQAGVSGQQNLETTLNYYKTAFGRNGINNASLPAIHAENFLFPGKPMNAQWRNNDSYMVFSIGGPVPATPIVSQPVSASLGAVAHEMTHGVTATSSGLEMKNESGALNESMSDAFAYLVRASVTNNFAAWLMYPDLFAAPVDGCLNAAVLGTKYCRSLIAPRTYVQPDRVNGQYYRPPVIDPNAGNDFGYVHTNMGIPNKVFQLMIAGGNHYGVDVPPFDNGGLQASAEAVAQFQYVLNGGVWYNSATDFETAKNTMDGLVYANYSANAGKLSTVDLAWYSVGVAMADMENVTLDNFTVTSALTTPMTNGELRYDASTKITVGGTGPYVVQAGAHVLFCAPTVSFQAGYRAEAGSTVTTECP